MPRDCGQIMARATISTQTRFIHRKTRKRFFENRDTKTSPCAWEAADDSATFRVSLSRSFRSRAILLSEIKTLHSGTNSLSNCVPLNETIKQSGLCSSLSCPSLFLNEARETKGDKSRLAKRRWNNVDISCHVATRSSRRQDWTNRVRSCEWWMTLYRQGIIAVMITKGTTNWSVSSYLKLSVADIAFIGLSCYSHRLRFIRCILVKRCPHSASLDFLNGNFKLISRKWYVRCCETIFVFGDKACRRYIPPNCNHRS